MSPRFGGTPVDQTQQKKPPRFGGGRPAAAPAAPAEPPPVSGDQQRADRLRKLALASMKSMGGEAGAGDLFGDNYTLGLQRPVGGLAGAVGGELGELMGGEPASFGERYRAHTGAYDDYLAEGSENAGWGGTAAKAAGSVLTGAPRRGADLATTLWSTVKNAGGFGAVEGAARNSDDLGQAAVGAGVGGATGAATGGALHTAMSALPSFVRSRRETRLANRGPEPEVIRDQSRALFQQLDDAGIAYSSQQSTDLVDSTLAGLRGFSRDGVHRDLNGVVTRLEALRGQPLPLSTLQLLREEISSNAGAMEPQTRRVAGDLLSGIDGYVTNVDPMQSQIPADQVGGLWREARRLWRTASTAEDMGWRLDKATRRSQSTASGANIDNPIRQNVRAVRDRASQPRRYNPYNQAEMDQMDRVIEGSTVQNALRSIGNQFGGSGPLGLLPGSGIGGGAGYASMLGGLDPMSATAIGTGAAFGVNQAGRVARSAADEMSENAADDLVRLISTGSTALPPMGPPSRQEIARLMATRGAGRFAAGEVTR